MGQSEISKHSFFCVAAIALDGKNNLRLVNNTQSISFLIQRRYS